ncbi:MAG: hypothetical protein ACKVOG_01930 [Rhodoglobus sp.]
MRTPPLEAVVFAASLVLLAGCATPEPEPLGLSAQERAEFTGDRNDERWQRLFGDRTDVERPTVKVIRYLQPEGLNRFWAGCVNDAGFDEVHEYGEGISFGVAASEVDAAYLAFYICTARYALEPTAVGYLSQRQLGNLYDYYASRLIPCLALAGYPVVLDGTRQQFVALGLAGVEPNPYTAIQVPSAAAWRALDLRCPPPSETAYGSLHP